MMIDKKFVYIKEKDAFTPLIPSIPKGLDPLVFIEDTREMWVCGTYFSIGYPSIEVVEESGSIKVQIGNSYFLLSTAGESLSIRKGEGQRIILSSNALVKVDTEAPLEWIAATKKLVHSKSQTIPGSYGQSGNLNNASIFVVPNITVDQYGHITSADDRNVVIRDYVEQLAPVNLIGDKNVLLSYDASDTSNTAQTRKARGMTYSDSTQRLRLEKGLDAFGPVNVTHGDMTVVDGYIVGKLKGDVEGEATPKIHLSAKPEYGGSSIALYGHVRLQDILGSKPEASSTNSIVTNKEIVAFAASPLMVWNAIEAAKDYADSILGSNNAMLFKDSIEAGTSSPGTFTPLAITGNTYVVSFGASVYADSVGYINGEPVEIGDLLICKEDTVAATSSNWEEVKKKWTFVQTNNTGVVSGPSISTVGQLAVFNSTTGKLIKALTNGSVDQMLVIGSSGIPAWVDQPDKLKFPLKFKHNSTSFLEFDGFSEKVLNFIAGDNVVISSDAQGNLTIAADPGNDTINTAGATNLINKKLFLIGAESQTTAPQTYSNQYVYVGTDNSLYSNGSKVSIEGHTNKWADITDRIIGGNEFNIVPVGYNADLYFNNKSQGQGVATVSLYHFNDGNTKYAPIKAKAFIVENGSISQFLKANGTLDSTAYLPLTGGTLSGSLTIKSSDQFIRYTHDNMFIRPYSSNNATGMSWRNQTDTDTISGIGTYTIGNEVNYLYIGWSNQPWETGTSLSISSTFIKYKNQNIWHAGNFNPGAYLPLSGGKMTGAITLSNNTQLLGGSSVLEVKSPYGSSWFGMINEGYCHIYTDAPSFYFNKELLVNNNKVWNAGNDGVSSGLDADLLDGFHGTSYSQRAGYGTTNSNVGKYYKININSPISWMTAFTVRIYHGYTYYDVVFSGYNYGANYWHAPKARLLGGDASITVYFGYDGVGKLWVGIPGDMYTGIEICNVVNGHQPVSNFTTTFSISIVSSLSTIQTTQTIYPPLTTNSADGKFLPLTGGIITGPLLINPTTTNHSEGIRIANQSNWSNINFGCVTNATSGLNPDGNQWLIGKNPSGQFVIVPNGSGSDTGLTLNRGGDVYWRNQKIWTSGNDGTGSGLDANLLNGYQGSTYLRSFWTDSPGWDSNVFVYTSQVTFTYSNNAPYSGALVDFSANGYGFQLNTSYGSNSLLAYRRHGTAGDGGMGAWQTLVRTTDLNAYVAKSGDTMTGALSWNMNGVVATIGNFNSSWTHFQTNSPNGFHFGKGVSVAGDVIAGTSYNRRLAYIDEILTPVGGTKYGQMNITSFNNVDNYGGAIQIREYNNVTTSQSGWLYAPAISFHWGGKYIKRFGMRSDGQFAVDDVLISMSGHTHAYVPLRDRGNYNDGTVINNVIGQLAWKNYGNNHTIFDASNGTTPTGVACDKANSQTQWTSQYPTLMGYNGNTTFGVRVDCCRNSDLLSGYAQSDSYTANTIVRRTSSSYIYGTYFWSQIGDENPSIGGVYVRNTTDNFIRRTSWSSFLNSIASSQYFPRVVFGFNTGSGNSTGSFQSWVTAMYNGSGYLGYGSITTGSWCWACALSFSSPVGSINPAGAMVIYSGDGSSNHNYKHFLVLDANADLWGITSNEESHKRYSKFLKSTDSVTKANKCDQLEAYTGSGFTGGDHYLRVIRESSWESRLYMGYYRDNTLQNSVKVWYADRAGLADRLTTARTLWGQPFDGTANISGSLSNVGNIAATGTISTLGGVYASIHRNSVMGHVSYALYNTSTGGKLAEIAQYYPSISNGPYYIQTNVKTYSDSIQLSACDRSWLHVGYHNTRGWILQAANNTYFDMHVFINNSCSAQVFNTTSDIRLKNRMQTISNIGDKIKNLNPFYYTRKSDNKKLQMGFSANEVRSIFPELVTLIHDPEMKICPDYYTLDYGVLGAVVAVAGYKELKSVSDLHFNKISKLENRIAKLTTRCRELTRVLKEKGFI